MKIALRILEPILLVLAVAWALVVVFVGGTGQVDILTHSFALITLLVLGFLPYAIVAGILRYIRARLPVEEKDQRGEKISNILAALGGIAVVLAVVLSVALPAAQKDIVRINTGDCQSDYYLRVSENPGPSHGYYYENGILSFFLNGRAQTTVDNPDLGTFTCYDSSDTDWSRFASDKNKVYFEGETIRNADPATFALLIGNYSKDGDGVFYATTTLDGADPTTFTVHPSTRYGTDANSAFFFGKKILGADVGSFALINNDSRPYEYRDFAKDKTHVYYQGEVVDGLTPAQFSMGKVVGEGTVYQIPTYAFGHQPATLLGSNLVWGSGLLKIEDPSTLEYIGLGLFKDNRRLYSTGYIQKNHYTGVDPLDILDPSKDISFLSVFALSDREKYIVNGDKVYALVSEMSPFWLEPVEGADAASFKLIPDSPYARDKNSVFWLQERLEEANPANFVFKNFGNITLWTSGNNVYWAGTLLEDIDLATLRAERDGYIIRDEDTAWFRSGNCDFTHYRKGSVDEIPNYTPPC